MHINMTSKTGLHLVRECGILNEYAQTVKYAQENI